MTELNFEERELYANNREIWFSVDGKKVGTMQYSVELEENEQSLFIGWIQSFEERKGYGSMMIRKLIEEYSPCKVRCCVAEQTTVDILREKGVFEKSLKRDVRIRNGRQLTQLPLVKMLARGGVETEEIGVRYLPDRQTAYPYDVQLLGHSI